MSIFTRATAFLLLISFISSIFFVSCKEDEIRYAPAIVDRDSLPMLKSIGVSTLISDSGIISYRLISEDWFIYDKKDPQYWSFEKGLFMEKYDKNFKVEAYLNCDTAYYYSEIRLWELRGRVSVRNSRGETFKTSKLYWNQQEHKIYSDQYMEIKGIDRELSGYDFYSKPRPDPTVMSEMRDTIESSPDSVRPSSAPPASRESAVNDSIS